LDEHAAGPDEHHRAHPQLEQVFAFGRNSGTDARPLPQIDDCYGKASEYPDDDNPGWPEGTQPNPSHFV
jgi:hypothetical protein